MSYIYNNYHITIIRNVTDVSQLGGVHSLDLSFCDNVTDVSALQNVHTLLLSKYRTMAGELISI
jgi:hypothetical protein